MPPQPLSGRGVMAGAPEQVIRAWEETRVALKAEGFNLPQHSGGALYVPNPDFSVCREEPTFGGPVWDLGLEGPLDKLLKASPTPTAGLAETLASLSSLITARSS
jgi:hypothetical protein